MLRITPIESGNHRLVLRLEGRVSGPWVSELSEVCEGALSNGAPLILSLAEVSFLDTAAVDLLTKLQTRGVEVVDCSMFIKEQLKTAQPGTARIGRSGQSLVSE
jgi:anti-anti-sigma regulatory factor